MGSGPEASGDGCRYCGRGPIQNTGKGNYAGMRDSLRAKGIAGVPDFEAQPELLELPADPHGRALTHSPEHPADPRRTFSFPEPAQAYGGQMGIPDKAAPADRPDPTKLEPTFGHLFLPDTRSPEEQQAASSRETAKRKGRGRGKWWEKAPG